MRYILSIIALLVALSSSASAQNIRLSEKIPDISVESVVGTELKLIEQEYTCLVFMHSKCEPCFKAIPNLHQAATPLSDRIAVVLITHETREAEATIAENFKGYYQTIVFDDNRQTHKAFGINFVPFCVIYNTKSRRIEWFGSLQQLNTTELNKICKTKK